MTVDILVALDTVVLDVGPFTYTEIDIRSANSIWPFIVISPYSIYQVDELPPDYFPGQFEWINGELKRKEEVITEVEDDNQS